jgi:hypothetical protein
MSLEARMPSRSATSYLIGFALIFVVLTIAPRVAHAGGYDVYACDGTVAGGTNNAFYAVADGGMSAYTQCPAPQGLVARNSYDGGVSGFLQGAYMIFDAPEGTSVDWIAYDAGLRRNDCGWGVELVASNYDLGGQVLWGLPAGQQCDAWLVTPDEDTYLPTRFTFAVSAPRVRIETRCGVGSCSRNGISAIHIRNVQVHVIDNSAPVLANGRGALWTSNGWLAGRQDIAFDASDGAGIREATAAVDGREVSRVTNACDYTRPAPCPAAMLSSTLSTAGFGDGSHTLTLAATDAGGNPASVSRTILIDNTAPDAPQNVSVDGGDGWRSTNDFTVRWTAPTSGTGAPMAAAVWDLCPATGTRCTHGEQSGDKLDKVEHLTLPAPGDYTLKLWLKDQAGNQDPRLSAPVVHLRYDDASPELAFEPIDPHDPTLVAVRTSDRGSGVGSGVISMRRSGQANWLSLPTTVQDGRLLAHIDDERLADGVFELSAQATDLAGNQRTTTQRQDGSAATITLPLRLKIGLRAGVVLRRGSVSKVARVAYAQYGQLVRVRGRLTSPEGNPLQDVEVQAYTQVRDGMTPPRLIATVKTSRTGRFAFLVRKGPSRTIRIRYAGAPQIRGVTRLVTLNVRSKTTIKPSRRHAVNGESVRFHGRIKTGRIPSQGKLVEMQVWIRGTWRTFATTRANRRGGWSYAYRFDGTRGRQIYRFRASVPREAGYPFATGRSRVVRVHVSGV